MVESIKLASTQATIDAAFKKVATQSATNHNNFANTLVNKVSQLVNAQHHQNVTTITVKAGDTVSDLAAKYHSSVATIGAANNLKDVNLILVNQRLSIPKTTKHSTASSIYASNQPTNLGTSSRDVNSSPKVDDVDKLNKTTTTNQTITNSNNDTTAEAKARAYIVQHESGDSYTARNGQYIGKYQLTASYLHGDYSPANQEKVANQYVKNRYGTWQNAMKHWQSHSWY